MNSLLMALDSISEKKGRSFLTMLGIIIGVTAVLVLVAMVTGYNSDMTAYYEKLGVNKVTVKLSWYDTSRSFDLMKELYEYGNGELSDMVEGITPDLSSQLPVQYGGKAVDGTTVSLGSDQYALCSNYILESGRDILQYDIENRSMVCVLGSYTADTLFPYSDPIGETVTIGGFPFLVVGTYYQKDGGAEDSMDHMAVVPYTVNRALLKSDRVESMIVKVDSSKNVDTVMSRLELWLAEEVDSNLGEYTLADGNSAMAESNDEMTSLSVVLGGIASIALLVGGIGIMNIMLVTVTERTREIGIKKSIGAPRWEIVGQFLLEAGILSSLGGLVGIALGFVLSLILGKAMYGLIVLPGVGISLGAFVFSLVIGVVFGIYPAVKASNLQPVDALRAD